MKKNITFLTSVCLCFLSLNLKAQQQQVSSLLSNYGLGIKFSESTVSQSAQGDLSVIGNNNKEVSSLANPALLSELRLTSFSASIHLNKTSVETSNNSFDTSSASLMDISLALPIGKRGAFGLGLRTDSAVGYEIDTEDFYNSANGGVNHIYAGFGYKIYKGLSLGLQLNQYFGRIEKLVADQSVQQSRVYNYDYNVTGTSFKLGLQYVQKLDKELEARLGAFSVLGYDVEASGTLDTYLALDSNNTFLQVENTAESKNISGTERNALRTSIGLGLGKKNKWFVGASYNVQSSVAYSGEVFEKTLEQSTNDNSGTVLVDFEDRSKYSLGGYWIPKKYALKNYLNRVVYRAGFNYEKTGLLLNNNSVNNVGGSFGLGFPVGKRVSYVNLALEYGKLGDVSENKYQENYFNVGLNFSLSDKWFKKRVIN